MGLAAEFCNRRTRVNNAPRSRQRTRRIDRLAGRDTTPDASMIQKVAGNKGVSESGGRRRSFGRRRLAGREVFTLKKRPLASTAPAELIYLQRDKASSPPLESSLSIGSVSNYPTNKITRSSASREPGRVEMVRRIISRRRGDHTQAHSSRSPQKVRECGFLLCAARCSPPRAWPLTAAAYQLDSSSQWQNKCLHAAPNTSAKAQCGRVERSRHCRSSTLQSELWSSCHRSSQRCIRACIRTALEMEAPKAFQVTRQTGKHNVQGDGPPLGAEGWCLRRRIGSPGASGLGLQSRVVAGQRDAMTWIL
jgi:hypothetical protein